MRNSRVFSCRACWSAITGASFTFLPWRDLVPGSAGHTMYGASKAFLVSFAQSLAAECDGKGVNVSALCPGFTYSEFHDVNETRGLVSQLPNYMFMDAGPVVEGALAAVEKGTCGLCSRRMEQIHGLADESASAALGGGDGAPPVRPVSAQSGVSARALRG